jgi:hypothetical protein
LKPGVPTTAVSENMKKIQQQGTRISAISDIALLNEALSATDETK